MYKENDLFDTPSDNSKIWRYLDFTKFMDLLNTSKLFFTRLDKLGDPFEGVCPIYTIDSINKTLNDAFSKERIKEIQKEYSLYVNKITAVNCWHINSFESAAMWKIYLKSGEGIAIQSNVKRLKNSLKDEKNDIFIGRVRYINYDYFTSSVDKYKMLAYPVIFKRKIFQHERELRAVIQKNPKKSVISDFKPTIKKDGIYVPVDLNILIDKIYIAPTSPKWQHELLESIITKFKLNKEVIQSGLDDKP